jgi:hypothetical protein
MNINRNGLACDPFVKKYMKFVKTTNELKRKILFCFQICFQPC